MIKLLVMIYNNEKKLKNILKKYKLNFNVMTYGSGTASLSLLTYFGLDKVKKSLYFSLIPSSLEKKVLQELETKLKEKPELREAQKSFYELFQIYKPEVVVLEKINVAGTKFGGDNVIKLAQLQAIIIAIAQNYNCKIIYVNPTSMKKYITGNGRAEKREVAEVVADFCGLNPNHICVPVHFKRKDGRSSSNF